MIKRTMRGATFGAISDAESRRMTRGAAPTRTMGRRVLGGVKRAIGGARKAIGGFKGAIESDMAKSRARVRKAAAGTMFGSRYSK